MPIVDASERGTQCTFKPEQRVRVPMGILKGLHWRLWLLLISFPLVHSRYSPLNWLSSRPWARDLTPLCLNLLIGKMGVVILPVRMKRNAQFSTFICNTSTDEALAQNSQLPILKVCPLL